MKRITIIIIACLATTLTLRAGITTYTFTSTQWASRVGESVCDGTTDGWHCDMAASEYSAGRTDAQGRLYSCGVSVKTGTSGAGATSVKTFTNVRRIVVNFCQNSSKGRGIIYFQIGANAVDSLVITKPATSGSGVYNRDSTLVLSTPKSGQIRFWIRCTENAINLSSLTIRSQDGNSPVFTQSTYQLVTDISQITDSDQIIFGVADGVTNQIMGYYNEMVSVNNIHAISGRYNSERTMVAGNDNAIYTVLLYEDTATHETVYVFQDELRYEEAYLVANGGRTKNKLTLWTDITSRSYGDYGLWRMSIAADGAAEIENCGTSERKYLQYNAQDQLFGCYATPNSQTHVALYREVQAPASTDAVIVAPMVNFGNPIIGDTPLHGSKTIEVNAMNLNADIQASLKQGEVFSLSSTRIDQDGDNLTIEYTVSSAGKYIDTLVLQSGETRLEVSILLNAIRELSIAEAVESEDFELVTLNPVVVTKKYDKYIFIRDESGSMLIFNSTNPATGKPYGQGLESGHRLSGVTGRFVNYYGVPEVQPTAAWTVAPQKESVLPEVVGTTIDSADVCRYIRIENVAVDGATLTYAGQTYPLLDAFSTGLPSGTLSRLDAIVMIVWDELQLWHISNETATGIEDTESAETAATRTSSNSYTILGQPVDSHYHGIIIRQGKKEIQ